MNAKTIIAILNILKISKSKSTYDNKNTTLRIFHRQVAGHSFGFHRAFLPEIASQSFRSNVVLVYSRAIPTGESIEASFVTVLLLLEAIKLALHQFALFEFMNTPEPLDKPIATK